MAWAGLVVGAGIQAVALVWMDRCGEASGGLLALHYLAFMCGTFAYHAGLGMVPIAGLALIARRRRLLIASVAVLALGIAPEAATLWPRSFQERSGETLKIMSVNLMYGRGDAEALLAQIEREKPDVVVFQEWTAGAGETLRDALGRTFPHSSEQVRDDAFGQAVFSKRPFAAEPRPFPALNGFFEPQICFGVDVGGRTMRITDVHLLPPVGFAYFNEQRKAARRYGDWCTDEGRNDRPDVLVGDFNAPGRTGVIRALGNAGLTDAHDAAGWWRGSTWPRVGVLAWAPGLRLDHAMIRGTVECVEARTGEDFGSDHRPVIVRVRWREAK